jgi:endonuclease YncB( thermonuclease family)
MIKEAIVLAALAFGQTPTIVDGDTVRIAGVSIRLTDYDTPELFSAKCPRERALAMKARQELGALLTLAEADSLKMNFKLTPCATSNWGRLCAEGSVDGKPLAQHMIRLGFASSYVCQPGHCPPKQNWCATPRPVPSPNAVRTWKFPDHP